MLITQRPVIMTEKISDSRQKFTIDSLEPGFGYTLGNSLRRTLLSSIPGAAVTSIVIDGVLHEFDTITGIKEDVTDIVLNIKNLVISSSIDEPTTVLLFSDKDGVVTAGDIKVPTGIEIHNKDLPICTLSKNAKIDMELVIERGRGYVSAQINKSHYASVQPGRIFIDSIYSPVLKVTYSVEATRVGQRTDFDKLILDIETKPSISPTDAIASAGKTLVELFGLAHNLNVNMEGVELGDNDIVEETQTVAETTSDASGTSIDTLDLPTRADNALKRASVLTVEQLITHTKSDLLSLGSLGASSIEAIINALDANGYKLTDEEK